MITASFRATAEGYHRRRITVERDSGTGRRHHAVLLVVPPRNCRRKIKTANASEDRIFRIQMMRECSNFL
jgi:hypothetical protein